MKTISRVTEMTFYHIGLHVGDFASFSRELVLFARVIIFSCHIPRFFFPVFADFSDLRGVFLGVRGAIFPAFPASVDETALKLRDIILNSS
ncbi:MAG: hypothetical protein LBI96_01915 [Odoribacteraceae bacterium]|nr:hypothetical protein [Odoribacteraceae bacterium]